jgi:hypothetical protein
VSCDEINVLHWPSVALTYSGSRNASNTEYGSTTAPSASTTALSPIDMLAGECFRKELSELIDHARSSLSAPVSVDDTAVSQWLASTAFSASIRTSKARQGFGINLTRRRA